MLWKIYCWLLVAVIATSFLSSGLTLVLVPVIALLIVGELLVERSNAAAKRAAEAKPLEEFTVARVHAETVTQARIAASLNACCSGHRYGVCYNDPEDQI